MGPTYPPPGLRRQRHWYIPEIAVGIVVTVLGSLLVWALGIGNDKPPQMSPISSVPKDKVAEKASIFTREVYARIQPGLTAWELEDAMGPPHLRYNVPAGAVSNAVAAYSLPESDGESRSRYSKLNATAPTDYEEMIWRSDRIIHRTQQHIAVLLENGEVIARRQVGVE